MVSLLVLVPVVAVAGAVAAGKAPPRIVAAVVRDSDGDFRADTLRLTYSQPVRHARDTDGTYPFTVAGYRIRSVGAAKGRVIVLQLLERIAPDPAARPRVRYQATRSKPVASTAGRQAAAQTFLNIRAHGNAPPPPLPPAPPPPAPPPPGSLDRDGDGFPDSQDCGPLDRTINPGAADLPDLAFVDSNCDGIDGREANAVFASPLGKDTNPGTKAAPKREIDAAVFAANGNGRYVLAADGLYTGVVAVTGVGIYGGYDARTWGRTASQATRIVGSPEGLRADDATGVVVQLLTVLGSPGAGAPSSYGIRAINGSSLTLQRVSVFATRAGAGAPGANGVAGQNGKNGEFGHPGTGLNTLGDCVSNRFPSGGGLGGISAVGRNGGDGGDGGPEGSNNGRPGKEGRFGTPGGAGGDGGGSGLPGKDGADGSGPGAPGTGGDGGTASTARAAAIWAGMNGGSGRLGLSGNGGGGGGGGGGRGGKFVFDMAGHGGAGVGAAGLRGAAGTAAGPAAARLRSISSTRPSPPSRARSPRMTAVPGGAAATAALGARADPAGREPPARTASGSSARVGTAVAEATAASAAAAAAAAAARASA